MADKALRAAQVNMKILDKMRFLGQAYLRDAPKMVYVLGWHNHNNLGDEAIYAAMQKLFAGVDFVDFPRGLEYRWVARRISQIDRAVLGGGTTISCRISNLNRLKYCFDKCSQTLVFGAGVTELEGWEEYVDEPTRQECKKLWKGLLDRCFYVGVRGPLSLSALIKIGCTKAEVVGDPVICMADDAVCGKSLMSRTLGLNVTLQEDMWGNMDEISDKLVSFVKLAAERNWNVVWFVVNPRDLRATQKIAEQTHTARHIIRIYRDYSRFKEVVKSCDVFVGTRLHSVVLATTSYVPSVMLDYKPKCRDFMASIDQERLTVRTDRLDVAELCELVENISVNRQSYVEQLAFKIRLIKEKQMEKARKLKTFLLES